MKPGWYYMCGIYMTSGNDITNYVKIIYIKPFEFWLNKYGEMVLIFIYGEHKTMIYAMNKKIINKSSFNDSLKILKVEGI